LSAADGWAEATIIPFVMNKDITRVKPNKTGVVCRKLLMANISKFSLYIYYELSVHCQDFEFKIYTSLPISKLLLRDIIISP
jgi:hypothetical protein